MSCQPNFLEQLLPLYKGTLSQADQEVLALFHLFESYRHTSVASVLSAWSAGAGTSSRPFEAITSVEPGRVFATSVSFPLSRNLRGIDPVESNEAGEGIYDPSFLLPLFAMALRDGLNGLDWVEIVRTNIIGLAISSLSSRQAEMRTLGGYILAKTMSTLEQAAFQEKPQLIYTLSLVRHAIPSPTSTVSQTFPRLPPLITTFLAHTLRALASPSNPLYADTSRFLLQRPTFDANDVPMLFGMLYASGENHRRDRAWVVRLIRDATRSEADWRLLKRRKTVELLESLYSISLDTTFRLLVLQALENISKIPPAALSLVHRGSFVQWLNAIWPTGGRGATRVNNGSKGARAAGTASTGEEEQDRIVSILENLVIVLVHREVSPAKTDTGKEKDHEEAAEKKKGREWVAPTERLLSRAIPSARSDRLRALTRTTLRMASVPLASASAARLFIALVKRLGVLYPLSQSRGEEALHATYSSIVQDLFQISLLLPRSSAVAEAEGQVLRRVSVLEGEMSDWVRRESRLAVWEAAK